MIKRASIVCAATLTLLTSTFAQAQDDEAEFDKAAERLRALLNEASEAGYVSMRGDEEGEPSSDDASSSEESQSLKPKTYSRNLRGGGNPLLEVAPGQCQLARHLNLDEYKEAPTYDDIYKLRSELVDGHGDYKQDIALKLAKLYLSLAMAEEAIALAEVIPEPEIEFIGTLAIVLTHKSASVSEDLLPLMACSDKASFWVAASLADTDPGRAMAVAKEHITEIGQIPPDLQNFFASRLGILAAEQEDYSLAQMMLERLKKLERPQDPSLQYLEALIGSSKGDQASLSQMRYLTQNQGKFQARALIRLGEFSERTPYDDYADDLVLVTAQYDGMSDSDLARQMNIRFLAEEGYYADAINTTLKEFPDFSINRLDARDSIASIVLKRLNDEDEKLKFHALNNYLDNLNFFVGYGNEALLRYSASRVAIAFELPRLLEPLTFGFEFGELRHDVDVLLAQAALMEGDASIAYTIASNYRGDPAFDMILVDASITIGDVDGALEVMERQPESQENLLKSAMIAWRFGEWEKAKDYYANLLLLDSSQKSNDRYNLASYMSGEQGGFFALELSRDLLEIQALYESFEDEQAQLRGYLNNG